MTDSKHRPSELSDVDLVRLLTRDKAGQSADVLAAAEAEALRRGLPIDEAFIPAEEAEEPAVSDEGDGELFENGGRNIKCTQCGHDRFKNRRVLLNTRGLTALNLDWLNEGATALTCRRCGLVQLFAKV
jgi:predicted nucleic-acid-binding Zn-ribbon protein